MDKRVFPSNTHLQLLPKGGGLDTEEGRVIAYSYLFVWLFQGGKE